MIATFYNVKHYDCSNNMNKSKLFVLSLLLDFSNCEKEEFKKLAKQISVAYTL